MSSWGESSGTGTAPWACAGCGAQNPAGATFCPTCGFAAGASATQQPFANPPVYDPYRAQPTQAGNGFTIAGTICGAVAFLFCPILLGPVGLILGAVAKSKGEPRANIALIVSGLGLVVGVLLGIIVFNATSTTS
jgi:hypothetical protein